MGGGISSRPHIRAASCPAWTDSEYLPSSTSFHDEHAHLSLATHHRPSTSVHSASATTSYNLSHSLPALLVRGVRCRAIAEALDASS